jgi:lysophospholipase L1-like esterase
VKIGFIELTFLSKEDFQNDVIVEEKFIAEAPIVINYDSINRANQIILDSLNNLKVLKLKHIRDSIIFTEKNIQYPSNNPELLYRFFKKLDNAKFKKVRIMHYGDSQIEGDRISGRLRQRLQNEFGGKGPGLFAIIPATRKISLNNTPSKNWVRKTGFGPYIDKKVNHKKYGALFSFCKMVEDSTYIDSNFIFNGEITIKKPTKSYKLCKSFKTLKIYYSCAENTVLKLHINDSIFHVDTLKKTEEINLKQLDFSKGPRELKLQFCADKSPLIYGISMEGERGVVVDNIPLRGASGTEFSKVDYNSLSQMQKILNPELIILEFGGNTIPYIKTRERAIKYGNYFKKQIKKLQQINPNAVFLIIGPADMAMKQKTEFITYPILEDVISALKNAAFETNSCFWDMYLNMGGENSIQKWVAEKPSLAARDYIHFTNRGAQKIADYFIEDFMHDYENYLKQKK